MPQRMNSGRLMFEQLNALQELRSCEVKRKETLLSLEPSTQSQTRTIAMLVNGNSYGLITMELRSL